MSEAIKMASQPYEGVDAVLDRIESEDYPTPTPLASSHVMNTHAEVGIFDDDSVFFLFGNGEEAWLRAYGSLVDLAWDFRQGFASLGPWAPLLETEWLRSVARFSEDARALWSMLLKTVPSDHPVEALTVPIGTRH